jgi:hemerythrin
MYTTQPLTWDDSFATGVPEIDEQHMILVHTLNEAAENLSEESSPETIERITHDLLSYALYHFETEEDLMKQYGYEESSPDDSQTHQKQHRSFSAKVVSIREGLKSSTPIAPGDLLEFLNSWLVNHILNTDKKLGSFIIEKRGG